MVRLATWQGLLFLGLAGCTVENPDFMAANCTQAERQCVFERGISYPVVCRPNDARVNILEREACPVEAGCERGLCVPPPMARTCSRFQDCDKGRVCVPLVNSEKMVLEKYCLPEGPGAQPPGATCDRHEDCKSYRCLQHGNRKLCLKACREGQSSDCGLPDECVKLMDTVTGVPGTVWSCRPFSP